jgi:23S rRNA pseudouridine2605 synthase
MTERGAGRTEGPAEAQPPERLQRTLARAGFGSRRSVEDLIRAGRVRIGERLAILGDRADPSRDRISVDGVAVPTHPGLRYFVLNKPVGVTSTLSDPHAKRSLASFLPAGPRVFPVGRLDRDSEGLILLTNDGELAHRLQHPSYGIEKEYLVEVEGDVPRSLARTLVRGIDLEDGRARAVRATVLESSRRRSALLVVLAEGRKREVRRMLDVLGHPVIRLVRVRVGPVRDPHLPPGKTRPLTSEEIMGLYRVTGLSAAAPRAGRT